MRKLLALWLLKWLLSVLGLNSGYTVKYTPLPSGAPSGTPSDKVVYLTVYSSSSPNMNTIFSRIAKLSEQNTQLTLPILISLECQCWNCNWECLYCDLSREIRWNIAWALEFPSGSGYISLFIPPLVPIQIQPSRPPNKDILYIYVLRSYKISIDLKK